MAEAPSAQTDT